MTTHEAGKLTFELYYDLLWNPAYQHNLNKAADQKQRKAFISHQVDHFDESDHEFGEDNLGDSAEDDSSPHSILNPSATLLNLRNPPRFLFPTNLGRVSRGS